MVNAGPPAGGGSGGDGGDDGSSGGGGGGDDGLVSRSFDAIAPEFLTNNAGILQAFLQNPRNFVVGALAATLLETLFGIVTTTLDVVSLIFLGSQPGRLNGPGETLGIADVPVAVADQIGRVGSEVGTGVIGAIESLNAPLFEAAGIAGPLSPLVVSAVVVGETILVLWLMQRVVFVVADLLQLGGLTE